MRYPATFPVFLLCTWIMLFAVSCQPKSETERMVERLAMLADTASSLEFPFLNSYRAGLLEDELATATGAEREALLPRYARELVDAGRNEAAIAAWESFLEGKAVTFLNRKYFLQLALSYLRLGEAENCLIAHTAQSCLVPIQGEGIHTLKRGSEGAVPVLEKVLAAFPNDLQARWMLTLASMTLGQYPGGPHPEWLIPAAAFASDVDFPPFPDLAASAGLDVNGLSGGCAIEDFNRDGYMDVFATGYGLREQMRLFLSQGNGKFREVTTEAGLTGLTGGLNLITGDYNNDGWVDVLVLRGAWFQASGNHPNSLLRNNGDGTFSDVTESAGLLSFHPTQAAVFTDVNRDGWLDIFIGNESGYHFPNRSEMYINDGKGHFANRAKELGLDFMAFVKGVTTGDANGDGWPDLYVSVLGQPNKLFINPGESITRGVPFSEQAEVFGVAEPLFSFPTWFWDYDQDGDDDLFVCSFDTRKYDDLLGQVAAFYLKKPFTAQHSRLYRNDGGNRFTDVTEAVGLVEPIFGMGGSFGDLNFDGFPDMYIGTGAPALIATVPNRAFVQSGTGEFWDVTTAGGFGQIQKGHAVSFGDLDQDGDLDIYTVIGGSVEGDVYRNMLHVNPGFGHTWIAFDLEGVTANRFGVGARIRVEAEDAAGNQVVRYATGGATGSFGANSLRIEFGLGRSVVVRKISVWWPDQAGSIETWESLTLNRVYHWKQGTRPVAKPMAAFSLKEGLRALPDSMFSVCGPKTMDASAH